MHVKEEKVYRRAGELLSELTVVWNELVEIVEEESQVATSSRLEAPGILAVEPVPADFTAFVSLLRVAATDPAVHAGANGDWQLWWRLRDATGWHANDHRAAQTR